MCLSDIREAGADRRVIQRIPQTEHLLILCTGLTDLRLIVNRNIIFMFMVFSR